MLYRYGNQWLQWNGHPSLNGLHGLGASIFGGGAPTATFGGGSLAPSAGWLAPTPTPAITPPTYQPPSPTITGGGGTTFTSGPQGAALPDSAALPAGLVTWVAQSATHHPGDFSSFLTGVDPYDLDIQGAHGAGGFGLELRMAILPWGNSSLRTVSDLRALLRNASAASGNTFAGDAVYAGDIVSGGVATPTITTGNPVYVSTPPPTASALPPVTGRGTLPPRTTTPPATDTTIIGPQTPAPSATGAGVPVSIARPSNQTCIPVFNHDGQEFTCLADHSTLPSGYQQAYVTLPNGSGFTAGVLPIYWLEVVGSGSTAYLRLNDFAGHSPTLTGPHVPSLTAAAPTPTIVPGDPLLIPRITATTPTSTSCPPGQHYNIFAHRCDSDIAQTPIQCPAGTDLNVLTGTCVPSASNPAGCPTGQFLQDDGACYPSGHCPPGETWQIVGETGSMPPGNIYGCGPAPSGTTTPPTGDTPCINFYNHEGGV